MRCQPSRMTSEQESGISEFACVSAIEVNLGSTGARLSKQSGCAIARQAWQGMEHLMQHRRRGAPSTWSSQMLVVNETVLDGARPRRRQPTGCSHSSDRAASIRRSASRASRRYAYVGRTRKIVALQEDVQPSRSHLLRSTRPRRLVRRLRYWYSNVQRPVARASKGGQQASTARRSLSLSLIHI